MYPAFSYTSYTKVNHDDALAIFAYLQSLPPVHQPATAPSLAFPYSVGKSLAAWRAVVEEELNTNAGASTTSFAYAASSEQPVSGGEITIDQRLGHHELGPGTHERHLPGGPMDVLDAVYGFLVYVDYQGDVHGGMAESLTSTTPSALDAEAAHGM